MPRHPRSACAAIMVGAAICAWGGPAASAPEPGSPVDRYVRMRAAVNALPVPPYVAFTEQDAAVQGGRVLRDRMRVVARVSDGHAWVRPMLDMQGISSTMAPRVVTTVVYPNTPVERIGDFPLADFGLRPRGSRPGMFEAPGTPEPAPPTGGLTAIGGVSTYNLSYRITDLGDTQLGEVPVFHLGLAPVRDPGHNVLREVWIDKTTFLPRRYVAERFVVNAPFSFRYNITVDTAVIRNHLVNVSAQGHIDVHRALIYHYSGEGHWNIEDVAFPENPPPWMFDPDRYAMHSPSEVPDL